MFRKTILLFTFMLVSFTLLAAYLPDLTGASPVTPIYIAHAGGAVDGASYQNTIEALDVNYAKGFRYFELDFSWTSDRALAGIHDWDQTFQRLFVGDHKIPDLYGFKTLSMKSGSTPITFDRLAIWMKNHADAWVVSDIKEDNLEGLLWVRQHYSGVADKMIPQIYAPGEYEGVKNMGYKDIILTMYRLPDSANLEVLSFAKKHPLLALTLPAYRFEQQPLAGELLKLDLVVCVHTINDSLNWQKLQTKGADCVYTDQLINGS